MSDLGVNNKTVLVVDDEECLLDVTNHFLKGRGYDVLMASTAAEALRIMRDRTGEIDLLLTDMRMPEMEGPKLVSEFQESFPHASVVYMTAYAQYEPQVQITKEPIFFKPFCMNALCDTVGELLCVGA